MQQLTLNVPEALNARLAEMVAQHNDRQNTKLTAEEWVLLAIRERAVADEVAEQAQVLERATSRNYELAVRAKKAELMAALDVDAAPPPALPLGPDG
jgi:hypothetical protein